MLISRTPPAVASQRELDCGGTRFSSSLLLSRGVSRVSKLKQDREVAEMDIGTETKKRWLLQRDATTSQYLIQGKMADYYLLRTKQAGEGLVFDSLEGCSLRTTLNGRRTSTWRLDPTIAIDQKSKQLSILVYQEGCGAGTPAKVVSSVLSSSTTLRISVSLEASPPSVPSTASPCDALPPQKVVLQLVKPVGSRVIINASDYPARPAQLPEGRRLVAVPKTV